jgi:hypothetical protein
VPAVDYPLDGVRNGVLTGKKLNIVVNDAEKEKNNSYSLVS